MIVLETERLILRKLSIDDAEFVLRLLNEPSFLRYIGDKSVRNLEDARQYILNGPIDSYEKNGFGLYRVELKDTGSPIGITRLVKRETLPHADIGFAFLPEYWSKGYALEAASAIMTFARDNLRLDSLLALSLPENKSSMKLLGKIGFTFERMFRLSEDAAEVKLFSAVTKGK